MKYVATAVEHRGSGFSAPEVASTPARSTTPDAVAPESAARRRVARSLLENGPSTVAALAQNLGITAAGVRRHLDVLLETGVVQAQPLRSYGPRSRGRPPKVFALTATGRDSFEAAYDDLATSALRFLADNGGDDLVTQFARRRVAELETRYLPLVTGTDDPALALAAALTADGYAASAQSAAGGGTQICQHHCPVAHVAAEFPQLCDAETAVFERLLGTHVQRLATIAHGDGVCTTHVPSAARSATPRPAGPERTASTPLIDQPMSPSGRTQP